MSVQGFTLEWEVGTETGEAAVRSVSAAFERASLELHNVMRHVGPHLVPVFEAAEQRQFDAEGEGPVAGHWASLSSKYADWKAQHFPGQPILQRTGTLREAMTSNSSPFAERTIGDTEFSFGTRGVPYASYHQVGTSHMPARPPTDFDSTFERDFREAAQLGVVDAMRAARLTDIAEVHA